MVIGSCTLHKIWNEVILKLSISLEWYFMMLRETQHTYKRVIKRKII